MVGPYSLYPYAIKIKDSFEIGYVYEAIHSQKFYRIRPRVPPNTATRTTENGHAYYRKRGPYSDFLYALYNLTE